jgi:DnaJ-class molecular chaperone
VKKKGGRGDLLVTLQVKLPEKLSAEQQAAVETLRQTDS